MSERDGQKDQGRVSMWREEEKETEQERGRRKTYHRGR